MRRDCGIQRCTGKNDRFTRNRVIFLPFTAIPLTTIFDIQRKNKRIFMGSLFASAGSRAFSRSPRQHYMVFLIIKMCPCQTHYGDAASYFILIKGGFAFSPTWIALPVSQSTLEVHTYNEQVF